ncbi:hypothetical protein LH384_33165, partial [Pseudomonas aeruginosa]|nr:hypothetical protein [Pseudomonas aeruginosa]
LMLLVFSGFYFLLAPYVHQDVGEGDTQVNATVPATEAAIQTQPPAVDKSSEYLILVNKSHGLGKDYEPGDLKKVKYKVSSRESEYQKLRKTVASAFN